jgi:hypothetical protein
MSATLPSSRTATRVDTVRENIADEYYRSSQRRQIGGLA